MERESDQNVKGIHMPSASDINSGMNPKRTARSTEYKVYLIFCFQSRLEKLQQRSHTRPYIRVNRNLLDFSDSNHNSRSGLNGSATITLTSSTGRSKS